MPRELTLSILCIGLLLPGVLAAPDITPVEDPLWGKWKGIAKFNETNEAIAFELDFRSNGTLEVKVMGGVVTTRYRVRDIHRLELFLFLPDGQGGFKTGAGEVTYRVTPDGLELGLTPNSGLKMPEKFQRIK